MTTEYKNIRAYSKMYNKVIALMGKCLKEGGAVTFDQLPPVKEYDPKTGCNKYKHYVNVKLEWNNG